MGGDAFPPVTKVLSCRATVFMDLLLFRRNLQMGFVSAEDKCDGCKVHTGYDRNFAALAPYFQTSNNLADGTEDLAAVGASAGAVLAIFGAIELEGEDVLSRRFKHLACLAPGTRLF